MTASTDVGAVVLRDVAAELARLTGPHRGADRRNGTSGRDYGAQAQQAVRSVATARLKKKLTWRHLLAERYWGTLAQTDNAVLRDHLIRLAALALLWAAALDGRATRESGAPSAAGGARAAVGEP